MTREDHVMLSFIVTLEMILPQWNKKLVKEAYFLAQHHHDKREKPASCDGAINMEEPSDNGNVWIM
jgi:hypothetical protein